MNAQAVVGPLVLNPNLAESSLPRAEERESHRASSGIILQRARALLSNWIEAADVVECPQGMAKLLIALIDSAQSRQTTDQSIQITTPLEAQQYLEQVRHEVLFVGGKRICVEFRLENGKIDLGLYDAFNGKGLGEKVIEKLRASMLTTLSQAA